MTGRDPAHPRPRPPSLQEVLDRLAVRNTDPAVVSDYAVGVIAARSKRRRLAGGTMAVLAVAAATAFAVMANSANGTDEVVTPADPVTTTTETARSDEKSATTTASTAPSTTAPIITTPTVPTVTQPGLLPPPVPPPPEPSTVPVTPVPTAAPTVPADRPGSGNLRIASGAAGELLELTFEFSDPDGPGGNPTISLATDEPGTPPLRTDLAGPEGRCDGGPGTSARVHERVQFASTGNRTVQLALKYCRGAPRVFNTTVEVTPPRFGDGPGRAVMAAVPDIGTALDRARWQFRPDGGAPSDVRPAADGFFHDLGSQGGFSTRGVVMVLPAGNRGELSLTADGTRYVGRVEPPPATRVTMEPSGASG